MHTMKIVISGPQGIGKSTLARALCKFISTQGYNAEIDPDEDEYGFDAVKPKGNAVIATTNEEVRYGR